jgi:hypothetical protein
MRLPGLIVLSFALLVGGARAHDSRPLFIEIVEQQEGRVELRAASPLDTADSPRVALRGGCSEIAGDRTDRRRQTALYACAPADARLEIAWPLFNPSMSALVRVRYRDGETRTALLAPSQSEWALPDPENFAEISDSYFKLGVRHIIAGLDHLLFLAGLLFIAGGLRRAMIAVTGFTIAHSLTLALVALGVLEVSILATEAVIALSIVFLAREIARGDRTTLAWRRPLLVAGGFGLAHGAGFAAALSEIGLPQTEKLAALLFFNLGVEAGQIAVAGAAMALATALRRAPIRLRGASTAAGYAIGTIAAYWLFERTAALLAPA